MSVTVVVNVEQDAVRTYGGRIVRPEGSLRIEVDASDPREGHSAIASFAERAHEQLRQAIEDIRKGEDAAQPGGDAPGLGTKAAAAAQRITEPWPDRGPHDRGPAR